MHFIYRSFYGLASPLDLRIFYYANTAGLESIKPRNFIFITLVITASLNISEGELRVLYK